MFTDLSFQPGSIVATIGHRMSEGIGYNNSAVQCIPIGKKRPGNYIIVRADGVTRKYRVLITTEPSGGLHFVGVKKMPQSFYRPSLIDSTILMSIPPSFSSSEQEDRYIYKATFNLLRLITTGALHRIVFDNHEL